MKNKKCCPICLNYVEEFKSGSHVIPRWAMKLSKDSGVNLKIDEKRISKNTQDLIAESWCRECEDEFGRLDSLGALFLRDNKFFVTETTANHPIIHGYETHRGEEYYSLNRFLVSIVVRFYLFMKGNNNNIENAALYENILKYYIAKKEVYFLLTNLVDLRNSIQEPHAADEQISFVINGYFVQILTSLDKIDGEYYTFMDNQIYVAQSKGPKHPYVQGLVERYIEIRKTKEPPSKG